jgi:teichuronic acid biosynthesis glycosyltransferase TuaG
LISEAHSKKDNRIRVIQNQHAKGVVGARQTGVNCAKGKYIAFLDSDDLWLEEKLEKQIDFMEKFGVSFSYTHYCLFNEFGEIGVRYASSKTDFKKLIKHCEIGTSTVILDTKSLGKRLTIPNIPKEDYALWIELTKRGTVGYLSDFVGTHYRVSNNSISSNKIKEISRQYNVLREIAQLGRLQALYCLSHYICKNLLIRFRFIRG